jgi:hypothetical protein
MFCRKNTEKLGDAKSIENRRMAGKIVIREAPYRAIPGSLGIGPYLGKRELPLA